MATYIKNNVRGFFFEIDSPLDAGTHDIGASIEEFHEGKWIPLTQEQAQFHREHPHAQIREVWKCGLDPGPSQEELEAQRIASARQNKLREIEAYDLSPAVNSFTLGGQTMWLDKATRVGLANSVSIEEGAGRQNTVLWFGGVRYELPIPLAKGMLATLELYALGCYNVTEQHKASVKALSTVEDIEAYDHTAGYPERLVFTMEEGGAYA